jgi:hypothetical protein
LQNRKHVILISSLFPEETHAAYNYRATRATTIMMQKALQNGINGEDGAIEFLEELTSPGKSWNGITLVQSIL